MILVDSGVPMYLVHVAVMGQHEIERILSFDTGFDRIPGMRRIV